MIGIKLYCPSMGIAGAVEATAIQGDGLALVRINDHWLVLDELVAV